MPLRSRLFADNAALQSCLVSNAAHIAPGARGEHVTLIQSALVRLRVLDPIDAAGEAGVYGPKTTAAVLAYKRAFRIINRSYQTQADNIVGKMTIASLDHAIWMLDGGASGVRRTSLPGLHPASPPATAESFGPGGKGSPAKPKPGGPAKPAPGPALSVKSSAPTSAGDAGAFGPPLSDLPPDVQAAVRRSNDAKKPDVLLLYPFIAKHEGPLPAAELSARFGGGNAGATQILRDLHKRMKPFDIWKNVRIIVNVYTGTGSRGLFCEPFDHAAFLAQMRALTTGPSIGLDPNVVPLSIPLVDSKFCRDAFNVHGPRDSFREMVKQGAGLHICITQPGKRGIEPCDLHIDDVQQGQVCSQGVCIPIVNGQTVEHLKTVGPWLAKEAQKWFRKVL